MFADVRHLVWGLLGFFDELVDLFFIGHYSDHFFFHFFVGLAVLLANDYVVGVLLYEAEYFLNDKVIDRIVFDFFSVLLKSFSINILYFWEYFFINLLELLLTYKFFENKDLFFDEETVKLFGHFDSWQDSRGTAQYIFPFAFVLSGFDSRLQLFIFAYDVLSPTDFLRCISDFLLNVLEVASWIVE